LVCYNACAAAAAANFAATHILICLIAPYLPNSSYICNTNKAACRHTVERLTRRHADTLLRGMQAHSSAQQTFELLLLVSYQTFFVLPCCCCCWCAI
jgi:hypothetical protein